MSRIEDLEKTVDKMSLDELLTLVQDIRRDRMTSKRIQATSSKTSRVKKQDKARDLLNALTPEQREQLLMALAGKK